MFFDECNARRITPLLPCNDTELGPALALVPEKIIQVFVTGTARALIPLVGTGSDGECNYALAYVAPGSIRYHECVCVWVFVCARVCVCACVRVCVCAVRV